VAAAQVAATLDGRTALEDGTLAVDHGAERGATAPLARARCAVLTGIGTVRAR